MNQKKRTSLKSPGRKVDPDEMHLEMMGLDKQTLPPDLFAEFDEINKAWILIDGQSRSIAEITMMCFDIGMELCPETVEEAMRNEKTATFSNVKRYNEVFVRSGITDFFRFACQVLMVRAIKFESLVDAYENTSDGRARAAEESGFVTFGPYITSKLCAGYESEIRSIRQQAVKSTGAATDVETVQLITMVAGLKALRLSADESATASFNAMLNSEDVSVEEIGSSLLARGVPFITQQLRTYSA